MSVLVAVATCHRPRGLGRLLKALARQEGVERSVTVCVVDNTVSPRSSEKTVDAWRAPRGWKTLCLHEPRRGISFARNRALFMARGHEFVAFVDDDEEPCPRWLASLLAVAHDHSADVVAGPVLPRFRAPVPRWLAASLAAERHATGAAISCAYTGNALLRTSRLDVHRFNAGLALSGGEDSHFFRVLAAAGARMVWADEAVVYEWMAKDRTTARAFLGREFRQGFGRMRAEQLLRPGLRSRVLAVASGQARVFRGASLLATPSRMRGLGMMAAGCGRLWSATGRSIAPYARPPLDV